jgi:methyl-accepting chemotaxis protein
VLAGIGGLVLLFGLVVGLALFLIVELREHEARLNDRAIPFSVSVTEAHLDSRAAANDERAFLLTADARFLAEFDTDVTNAREALTDAVTTSATDARRRQMLAARAGFDEWVKAARRGSAAYRRGGGTAAMELAAGQHRALWRRYEASLAEARTEAASVVAAAARSIDSRSNNDITLLAVLLSATILIGAGVAIWLVRSVVRPMSTLIAIFARDKPTSTP